METDGKASRNKENKAPPSAATQRGARAGPWDYEASAPFLARAAWRQRWGAPPRRQRTAVPPQDIDLAAAARPGGSRGSSATRGGGRGAARAPQTTQRGLSASAAPATPFQGYFAPLWARFRFWCRKKCRRRVTIALKRTPGPRFLLQRLQAARCAAAAPRTRGAAWLTGAGPPHHHHQSPAALSVRPQRAVRRAGRGAAGALAGGRTG